MTFSSIGKWFDTDKVLVASFIIIAFPTIGIGQSILGRHSSVTIGGQTLSVEVARTPKEQAKGLSDRDSLPADAGMLFVYEEPGIYGFWMRDMKFSIDIIWIGPDKKVVDITSNLALDTYPQVFQPRQPAQYVLEVNAGFAVQSGVQIGDSVQLP